MSIFTSQRRPESNPTGKEEGTGDGTTSVGPQDNRFSRGYARLKANFPKLEGACAQMEPPDKVVMPRREDHAAGTPGDTHPERSARRAAHLDEALQATFPDLRGIFDKKAG